MCNTYELNQFNFSPAQNFALSTSAVKLASATVKTWRNKSNLKEMPGIISLDCVIDANNNLKVVSIEKTPLGVELLKVHKPSFSKVLSEVGFPGSKRKAGFNVTSIQRDHSICFPDHPGSIFEEQMLGFMPAEEDSSHEPEVAPYNKFSNYSYNTYGEGWLWQKIDSTNCEEVVDFDAGCCFKAIGQRRVFICPPKAKRAELRKNNIGGRRTVSQMLRKLNEYEEMYYQPFIEPNLSPDGHPMIYSLYFVYNYKTSGYVYAGGLSIARKHLNVVLYGDGVTLGVIE